MVVLAGMGSTAKWVASCAEEEVLVFVAVAELVQVTLLVSNATATTVIYTLSLRVALPVVLVIVQEAVPPSMIATLRQLASFLL